MAKTIVLNQLEVKKMVIDITHQKIVINFDMKDDAGKVWMSKEATFWVKMPPAPIHHDENDAVTTLPQPDEYFLIPSAYVQTIVNIVNDATAAITAKFLV